MAEIKCLNCPKEVMGRSKFCSGVCWAKYQYKYNEKFRLARIKQAVDWKNKNPEKFKINNRKATKKWQQKNPQKICELVKKWQKKKGVECFEKGICFECGKKEDDKKYLRCLECRLKHKLEYKLKRRSKNEMLN